MRAVSGHSSALSNAREMMSCALVTIASAAECGDRRARFQGEAFQVDVEPGDGRDGQHDSDRHRHTAHMKLVNKHIERDGSVSRVS